MNRRSQHLEETEQLAKRLSEGDESLRIVDMRGKVVLKELRSGFQEALYLGARVSYCSSHIPGAIYLDWTSDLADEDDPIPVQAAPSDKLECILGSAGIGNEHAIVAYDDHPSSQFATRLWWLLRYYGHDNVRILDGGWKKWLSESREVSTNEPMRSPASFTARTRQELRITADQLHSLINDPELIILDARDEGQFTGRVCRGGRGGHIPGAISLPRERLMTPEGSFHSLEKLQELAAELGITSEKRVVAYCNGGVAATSALFALSMLGFQNYSNYDGSWNEWNLREDLPVEI